MLSEKVILQAKNIKVQFKIRGHVLTAIRNISMNLYEKEVLALVGESGSGKSVFTKTFTGMLDSNGRVSKGEVIYNGKTLTDIKTNKEWGNIRGKEIATIFQDPMTSLN
ncbi:MAG: ATP-binding cassette domain-containing protein, partial [Lactobacillales bacterium]|nr:ATP-binding cassette domain-containing protein [Lactobacillales bacterium]